MAAIATQQAGLLNSFHALGDNLLPQALRDQKDLLGHKNGDITSHYSAPEIEELLEAANRVCRTKSGKSPAMTLLKRKIA
jgi:hypothetical protein